jgi:hypothetical protein
MVEPKVRNELKQEVTSQVSKDLYNKEQQDLKM